MKLTYTSPLHQQMLQAAQQKLKATLVLNPDDVKLLETLAGIYRQQGLLCLIINNQ